MKEKCLLLTAKEESAPPLPDRPCAWFLDLDGTLLEIAETPDLVKRDPPLVDLLHRLHAASEGALALISGRSIETIDRLVSPLRLPSAGQHGAERRSPSGRLRHGDHWSAMESIRRAVRSWCTPPCGLLLEDKGLTLAVHYRQAPWLREHTRRYLQELIENREDLRLSEGRMVLEVVPSGTDKGKAVAEFMSEHPFRGRRPVFVGDDITDEDAFAVVEQMGGITVKVGAGSTLAGWRLADVGSVRAWIGAWLERYPSNQCIANSPDS